MSKRMYVARVEIEMLVIADNEKQAEREARRNLSDAAEDAAFNEAVDVSVATSLPYGWDPDSLPWGEADPSGKQTVGWYLEQAAKGDA